MTRRFGRVPPWLHHSGIRLDNLAIVPASLLPIKAQWQQLANDLPRGDILIVLPAHGQPPRRVFEKVAGMLMADGHNVTTLTAARLRLPLSSPRRRVATGQQQPLPEFGGIMRPTAAATAAEEKQR